MNNTPILWEDDEWCAQARGWIGSALAAQELDLTDEIEQPHIRPWSTVMRVPTTEGPLFFKATAPYLAHEIPVTEYLANFRPGQFPELLAVDRERGWMLMRDAGVPLRQFIRAEKSFARWQSAMPLYTQLQQGLGPHVEELLALGLFDRRLNRLPDLFEALVADEDALLVGQEESLTPEEYTRLRKFVPEFRRMCEELVAFGIPETIHHDDFHDGNLFLRDGRILFTDWAESAVTHPFFSLVVLLRGAGNSLEAFSEEEITATADTPEIAALRELYLENWMAYGSLDELRRVAQVAERLGLANRALTWHYVISNLPEELKPEYALAVPAYLQEFING